MANNPSNPALPKTTFEKLSINNKIEKRVDDFENAIDNIVSETSTKFSSLVQEYKDNQKKAEELNKKKEEDYKNVQNLEKSEKKIEQSGKKIESKSELLQINRQKDQGFNRTAEIAIQDMKKGLSAISDAARNDLKPKKNDDQETKKRQEKKMEALKKFTEASSKALEEYTKKFFEILQGGATRDAEKQIQAEKNRKAELEQQHQGLNQIAQDKKVKPEEINKFQTEKKELESQPQTIQDEHKSEIDKLKENFDKDINKLRNEYVGNQKKEQLKKESIDSREANVQKLKQNQLTGDSRLRSTSLEKKRTNKSPSKETANYWSI